MDGCFLERAPWEHLGILALLRYKGFLCQSTAGKITALKMKSDLILLAHFVRRAEPQCLWRAGHDLAGTSLPAHPILIYWSLREPWEHCAHLLGAGATGSSHGCSLLGQGIPGASVVVAVWAPA